MAMKKIIAIIFLIIFILSAILAYNWIKETRVEKIKINMEIYPKKFYMKESESQELTLKIKKDDTPLTIAINWTIEASGDTGKLIFQNTSITDEKGILKAIYYAPDDVDKMKYKVRILAKLRIGNKEYKAMAEAIIHPKLYNTSMALECDRSKIIAGETLFLKASLFAYMEKLKAIENATILLKFYKDGKKFMEDSMRTDSRGVAEYPFFLSNVEKAVKIKVIAEFKRNLLGDIDYGGCSANISFEVMPEKPGDFPVVLIHGWIGSINEALLNFTWWNLTEKLVENGYKVLDFNPIKPGIQWLTYEPEWKEHHIPWIAARVCEEIKKALIFNGYSPNQTIDIVAHSMGGLIARFMAEHYLADVDYWNKDWNGTGYPWYGDGDADITIGAYQIDDLIVVGTPCHGVPPNINEDILKDIIKYAYFPWWIAQVPDMIYNSPFLQAMGYKGTDLVDYYAVGGDIGIGEAVDFDGDGIAHRSDGLCPTESPYLEGKPLYILEGKAMPFGEEDHMSLIATNEKVHEYILQHLID